jgi:hypothetical protein
MFDILMYLVCAVVLLCCAVVGLGLLMLPVYFLVRIYDELTAPTAEQRAEIEALLAEQP